MNSAGPLVSVSDVSNDYTERAFGAFGPKTSKHVLDHITMEVEAGEIFGIVGESGSGKSTLANCILGLIPYSGDILFYGKKRASYGRLARASLAQAVFQDPASSLNPAHSVGWALEEPLKIHGLGTKAERIRKVDETLELIGLDSSYKRRMPSELSGGQKQRVSIGLALMLSPKLLIADEAVSSLDVSVGAQILNLLGSLKESLSLSILFISHNLDVVYYLCDRIAVLHNGRVVEAGDAQQIYDNPQDPYTRELFENSPSLGQ